MAANSRVVSALIYSVKDPYKILGVSEFADDKDIRQAYRMCWKKYHPDKNPGINREFFDDISDAQGCLLPGKRQTWNYIKNSILMDMVLIQDAFGLDPGANCGEVDLVTNIADDVPMAIQYLIAKGDSNNEIMQLCIGSARSGLDILKMFINGMIYIESNTQKTAVEPTHEDVRMTKHRRKPRRKYGTCLECEITAPCGYAACARRQWCGVHKPVGAVNLSNAMRKAKKKINNKTPANRLTRVHVAPCGKNTKNSAIMKEWAFGKQSVRVVG